MRLQKVSDLFTNKSTINYDPLNEEDSYVRSKEFMSTYLKGDITAHEYARLRPFFIGKTFLLEEIIQVCIDFITAKSVEKRLLELSEVSLSDFSDT